MTHFIGHQQALVKDNIVVAVLVFEEHPSAVVTDVIDYDDVVDLCLVNENADIGSLWNGSHFSAKPFDSWTLDKKSLEWIPPIQKPEGNGLVWNDSSQVWETQTMWKQA